MSQGVAIGAGRRIPGRRLGLALALLTLLIQTLLPILHQPIAADGGSVVICTPYGMKVVPVAALDGAQPPEDGSQPRQPAGPSCPACFASHQAGTVLPPQPVVLPGPAYAGEATFVSLATTWTGARLRLAAQPRAPPLA